MVMRRRTRAAVAAAVAVLLATMSGGAAARATTPSESDGGAGGTGVAAVIARYRERIPALMAEEHVPGLALAVVDGDRVLWQQGFGSTDDGGGRPVTVDTLFSVQSVTKPFTATAVMRAVQAGRVDLDAPITTYLPGFRVHSAFEPHPERRITLRRLLSCTAGFTHEAPLGNNFEPEPGTFDAHVRSISQTWLRFPVGTGYAYSNLGFDLAAAALERVYGKPYPALMRDSLLDPLGMEDSTFDRAQVHATTDRAVGHSHERVRPSVDIPMTAAGGLWSSAADLARFLRFQLGDGRVHGHPLLDAALVREQRTVPAPDRGAAAGYALGVERWRWWDGANLTVLDHGGGGFGFLSDLRWLPQVHLGVVVLTNASEHDLQGRLSEEILRDLVVEPGSPFHQRLVGQPVRPDAQRVGSFSGPPDLSVRIGTLALPSSIEQYERWAGYPELYRTGQPGAMDPTAPPSRFHVDSGVPYFDAAEDGTPVLHRLTEFRPGLFLAENGETLDLRASPRRWRGLDLNPVTNGPLAGQWALLLVVGLVAAGWLVAGGVAWLRARRTTRRPAAAAVPRQGRTGRRATALAAALGALAALASVVAIRLLPGLVDVGFLGGLTTPLPLRLAFHLPLAVALLAAGLAVLLVAGALWRWWTPRVRARDAALAVALSTLAVQLASWHLVGWGFWA
jgi:CubicO group peptidase (beta-lactamase class C family)